jgi:cell division protease FtsH
LAELLLEKEVIFKKDLETIFGKRPFDKDEPLKKEPKEDEKSEEKSNNS